MKGTSILASGRISTIQPTPTGYPPELHLGHKEHGSAVTRSPDPSVDRWKRAQEREKWKRIEELLAALVTEEIQSIVAGEIRLVAVEQIETARQYFKPADHRECSSKIEALQMELAKCKVHTVALTAEINKLMLRNA